MVNLSEDIQCADSDTRPPMLDKTDFASWQQCIRLYCRGKKNGVNIMKSIDEGPFQMGTFRETLAEGTEGALTLGHMGKCEDAPEGSELTKEDRESQLYDDFEHFCQDKGETIHDYYVRFAKLIKDMRNIKMTMSRMQLNSKFVNNMLPEWGTEGQGNNARGGGAAGYGGAQNRVRNANLGQAKQIKCYNCNGISHIARNCTQPKRPQNSEYFKDKMLLMQAQKNGVALDEEQLLFIAGGQDNAIDKDVDEQPVQDLALNVDNMFQADDCDAFDSDVDEAPTTQTMFMANLSSADPVYDEAGPSYDSDILSEVHDHDHYQDVVCKHHEEHEMHDDYVKDNAMSVVQSNVSSIPNDAYMMIFNDMHETHAQPVSVTTQNTVVDNSLTAKLATYKEQVELYERRARFELTEREQKIDEQLRIVITDRNIKEETLKKELHSVKMQLASTINHNKSMVEEVTSLKKDFKQKENKYLEEFLDMKALKEKVEDKLYKQDQSLQTVHMLCKPKPYYNEQNKVAIGYKNPLCLTRAKQVQPALYNGYEIIKNNHVPAIVHNTEDTLEIAEITRRKMNDKMKDPECVTHKVKIAPPDYSKENYLATFTPQKQLTPEQIFWSQDLIKMKAEALKEQTTASRPIKALTVYPPNTPATLVPRVLPTKSQVKINIFTLIQLFSEFEKTCKKRITPTGLTEGERGFEQTKECYLTEVIPFFKTLKEHFEGIQKALTKEIKEMKDVFEELEAEVDQNVVDRKHDEIERKNLLIAHDNLSTNCLSKEVFYVATNSELNVYRFTEMHDAHTIVEARCLELEDELSNLRDKIQNDNHNELVKWFSNLEVNHLNLQLKYQNLKESFGNNPSTPARDTPDFDLAFVIGKMKASLQGKDNGRNAKIKQHYKELYDSIKITHVKHLEQTTALTTENENLKAQMQTKMKSITEDHVKPVVLTLGKYAIDVELIPPRNRNNREVHLNYLRHRKESVETLHEIVEEAKVERPLDRSIVFACRYTKHSQELLEYTNVPVPPSTGVNCCTNASGSQPRSNTKKNKISPAKGVNQKKVEKHLRTNKSNLRTTNHVDSSSSSKRTVIQIVLWYLDSGCSKHMTGDRSWLRNFVKKFIGTIRFENDHFGSIMGYGDYVIGDSSRGSNLYIISIEDMMNSSPICLLSKASKNKSWLWHRRLNHLNFGTINDLARKDLVRGLSRLKVKKDHLCSACRLGKSKKHTHKPKPENTNLEVLNTLHMDLCGPMRVQTIIGNKYILVIVDDYSRFTWVKFLRSKDETPAVVIKFLKQIQVGLNKTVRYVRTDNGTKFINKDLTDYYERVGIFHQKTVLRTQQQNGRSCGDFLLHQKLIPHKPDLTFFRVFGALCYPTNDSEDLGKLQPTADIGIFVGYAPSRKGYRICNKRTRRIMETIHVYFDELTEQMAHIQLSTGPAPSYLTPGQISSGLVPNQVPAAPYVPPTNK
ncbi:retrovirus-related pol polyprotein from transposon TNT 1-94 [Tanacetum coccineum]